jgi:hypothetical protein
MRKEACGQLKSLRSFLRIFLRSSAYSSMIRRASSVREGLLGDSGGRFVILRHRLNGALRSAWHWLTASNAERRSSWLI